MSNAFTILDGVDAQEVSASITQGRVHLSPEALETSLGWKLDTSGLCRGDVCVLVPDRDALVNEGALDLERVAELLERPIAIDIDASIAALGTPAHERKAAMEGLVAPDFSLPDLTGQLHSLSQHRGKKVLLIAYASW